MTDKKSQALKIMRVHEVDGKSQKHWTGMVKLENVQIVNFHLFKPSEYHARNGKPLYVAECVIGKDQPLRSQLLELIKEIATLNGLKNYSYFINDGDNQKGLGGVPLTNPKRYRFGHWYFTPKNESKIRVVGKSAQDRLTEEDENKLFNGINANVHISLSAFKTKQGVAMVTFKLHAVQILDFEHHEDQEISVYEENTTTDDDFVNFVEDSIDSDLDL